MAGYSPLRITGMASGLVQDREEFILPNDAYPVLENAFVWRERIKRKMGYRLLGRLRRLFVAQPLGNTNGAGAFSGNLKTIFSLQTDSSIEVGSVIVSDGVNTFTDNSLGVLIGVPGGSGTINYTTGAITISGGVAIAPLTISFNYFPNLPVMGLRTRELDNTNNEQLVAFDQVYAYVFNTGWQEFIPGVTWTGNDSDFFWSTNYWVSPAPANLKLFWVTNFSGTAGDPIRYTNGTAWVDFAPTIDAGGNKLNQCLAMLPFRGRLVVFNTLEGASLATSTAFTKRIRWAAIGNPISDISPIFPLLANVSVNAWSDDIRGKGGFLDIPTSESIISVGFVRDNLVIYCERSTWQLRYTGRSIAPFQIEKINSELGAESTFSAVQFDTSLVGIGDKGVVECDSFKSDRIDIKIPDLIFRFNNDANGTKRVHGIRDFQQRIAYWTYPLADNKSTFPDRRLVYNYENDSWAIFTDSFTTLGTFQPQGALRWLDFPGPDDDDKWENQDEPWVNRPSLFPAIVGGNQQGFVEYLGQSNFEETVTNGESLFIKTITGNNTTPTVIGSPNHNLQTGQVIQINDIPVGTPFATSLNDQIFGVVKVTANSFQLWKYNSADGQFTIPQTDSSALVYIGGGLISIRDGFSIKSKKFNFLDEGQNIQIGYIDILMDSTDSGAITLNMFLNYSDDTPVNILPENENLSTTLPDTFFNSVVPTSKSTLQGLSGSKYWHRVFCPVRGNFITIEWKLSNAQLVGVEQESRVQIDSQVIWMRKAGRMTNI